MWEGVNPNLSYVGDSAYVEQLNGQRKVNGIIGAKFVRPEGCGPND